MLKHNFKRTILNERIQSYLNIGIKIYPEAKFITNETYKKIKSDFENGDETAMLKLFEESMGDIILATAKIYANYEIGDYIPFEDGLSHTLENMLKQFSGYKYLKNTSKSYFVQRVIDFSVYMILARMCDNLLNNSQFVPMRPEDVIWYADKQDYDDSFLKTLDLECRRLYLEEIMTKLNKREQLALRIRFGFETGKHEPLTLVAKRIGITQQGASHLVAKAIEKLQNMQMSSEQLNNANIDSNI